MAESSTSSTSYRMVEIWDSTHSYKARMNISETIQHNRPTSSQTTMNSKYPFHIHSTQFHLQTRGHQKQYK